MGILKQFKSVGIAFIPVIVTIIVMNFLGSGFETSLLTNFAIGVVMVVVGEVVFLRGIDSSIMNMGEIVGNASNRITKFFILVIFGFIFGFFTTMAEPSVQILAEQAIESGLNVPKFLLVFALGFGTGACVALALFRIVSKWGYKVLAFVFYAVVFGCCFLVPRSFIAIAFDGGGATISNVASPFLLALAAGVARNKSQGNSKEDNFGIIGIASMGPILAVLIVGMIFGVSGNGEIAGETAENSIWLQSFYDISLSIIPLLAIFFIFEAIFVKIPNSEKKRIILGTAVTFIGLYLFLVGIEFGFIDMGKAIGNELLNLNNPTVAIIICGLLAFALCYSEPAVSVLAGQVDELTNGNIKSGLVLLSIAIAFTFAIVLAVLKVLFNLDVFIILCIGYAVIFVLIFFTSNTFVTIAFDSGGVASGPMTSSFIMPIMLGLAGVGNEMEGFGCLAFVAMMPIMVIETLGIIYNIKVKAKTVSENKRRKALAVGEDELSNICGMEKRYNQILKEAKNEETN